MTISEFGTVAQLVYADQQPLDFARLVGAFRSVLSKRHGPDLVFTRDCEDIAFFDLPATRIALRWDDCPGQGYSACLTVSVAPLAGCPRSADAEGPHDICRRIVERLQRCCPAVAVLWHQTREPLTSDLMDRLGGSMPAMAQLFPVTDRAGGDRARMRHWQAGAGVQAAEVIQCANDQPTLPRQRDPDLARLRQALYPAEIDVASAPLNTQMRLTAHALNATLIIVWAPLGAAMMTYALLKGEDMRLSARMAALTGLFVTVSQSPLGQQMATMIGA